LLDEQFTPEPDVAHALRRIFRMIGGLEFLALAKHRIPGLRNAWRRAVILWAASTPTSVAASGGSRRALSMSNYDRDASAPAGFADRAVAADAGPRAMLGIYNCMAVGVGLTGVVAFLTYQLSGPALLQSRLIWVLALAPLALVFFISSRINTLSAKAARLLFFVYAASVGLSLSTIFHVYTEESITRVFFISAATFGALSI
jgi:hypothetical protein